MHSFDVVIIGASFSGLTLAHHLPSHLRVLVVDVKPSPGATVESTGLITTKTYQEFKTFFDIDSCITNPISAICVVAPSYEDFFVSSTQEPWIYQTDTRKLIAQLARTVGSNVEVRMKTVFLTAVETADSVEVSIRTSGNELEKIRTRVLVGADGSHSVVAKTNLHLDRNERFLFGLEQVFLGHAHLGPNPEATIYHFWFGEFSLGYGGWLSPTMENGRPALRIGLAKCEKERADTKALLSKFIEILQERKIISLDDPQPTYTFASLIPINAVRRRTATKHTILIGDAAGYCGAFAADGIKGSVVSGKLAGQLITERLEGKSVDFQTLSKRMNHQTGLIDYYHRQLRYRFIWDQMKRNRTFDAMYQIIKRERESFLDQFCDSKNRRRSLTWTVLKWRHIPALFKYAFFLLMDFLLKSVVRV